MYGGFNDNNGAAATIYFPKTYFYDGVEYVIEDTGSFGSNSANPSFAIEGTYTGQPPFSNSGWDAIWVSGALVNPINAVAGHSSETDVSGTASIPSYYAESGILILPAVTASLAGPLSPFVWLIGGILLLPVVIVYSKLARIFPFVGSKIRFINVTHGKVMASSVSFI